MASGTQAVIRRAQDTDLAAVAWLRRESAAEQDGDGADPSFEERSRGLGQQARVLAADHLAG